MKPELYAEFLALRERGRREESGQALAQFVASFRTPEGKRAWVQSFLEADDDNRLRIHTELYENLVFPVLHEGYLRNDAWSVFWLARTAQNLYALRSLHETVGFKSDFDLFTQAYQLEPTGQTRRHLLATQVRWFRYCQHEWPAGILYGADGASTEEVEEILREIRTAKGLDKEGAYTPFLDDFEAKVRLYKQRILSP
jgi:hypothetical protein